LGFLTLSANRGVLLMRAKPFGSGQPL